jgi:hypothetical protein
MIASVRLLVASAVLALFVGCVKYPVVKPEAFNPRPKMAVISFQSEPVAEGTLGLPIKVDGIDEAHAAFAAALAGANYELVDVDTIRSCQKYFQLPKPAIDMGTSAKGLERVYLTKDNVAGLAQCVNADVIVSVTALPKVVAGFQVAGVGSSKVNITTEVRAWNNDGLEIWKDRLQTKSDGFPVAGKVMDPRKVNEAAVQALKAASTDAVARFSQSLAAAPAPAAEATASDAP